MALAHARCECVTRQRKAQRFSNYLCVEHSDGLPASRSTSTSSSQQGRAANRNARAAGMISAFRINGSRARHSTQRRRVAMSSSAPYRLIQMRGATAARLECLLPRVCCTVCACVKHQKRVHHTHTQNTYPEQIGDGAQTNGAAPSRRRESRALA